MAQIIRALGGLTRPDLVDVCRILEESFSPALREARILGKFWNYKIQLLFDKGKISDATLAFGRVMGGKIYCHAQANLILPTAPFRLDATDFKVMQTLKKNPWGSELANKIVSFLDAKHDKNLEPLKQVFVSPDILDHPYAFNFNGIGSHGKIVEAIVFSRVQFTGIRAIADYPGTIFFAVQVLAKLNELL